MRRRFDSVLTCLACVILLIGFALDLTAQCPGNGGWSTGNPINSAGDGGGRHSLAFQYGYPHISYSTEQPAYDLRHTWFNGTWNDELVDDTGTIAENDIIEDVGGALHVSYNVFSATDLKYACKVAGSWQRETVDTAYVLGENSIALDEDDIPYIAYTRSNNLYLAVRSHGAWNWSTASWTTSIVDSPGTSPNRVSMVIDDNSDIHIAYTDYSGGASNGAIKYAYSSDGGSSWTKVDTQEGANYPEDLSLDLDSNGNPHIAFHACRSDGEGLWLVSSDGSSWSTEVVHDPATQSPIIGWGNSLKIDSCDAKRIAYTNVNAAPNGPAVYYIIDTGGGWSTPLVIDTPDAVSASYNVSLDVDDCRYFFLTYFDNGATEKRLYGATCPIPAEAPCPSCGAWSP